MPPSRTACGPLARDQKAGDEDDLAKTIGGYSCVAVQSDVRQTSGRAVGLYGLPFVAAIDFMDYTYTWCKDTPVAGAGDEKNRLAFVRLSRACRAAEGAAFSSGYVVTETTT